MSSIVKRKTKSGFAYSIHCRIDGERRVISLDQSFTKSDAEEIRFYIDRILTIRETNRPPDRKTILWIDSLPKDLKQKLARLDLIDTIESINVGELWERFLDDYENDQKKPMTISNYKTVKKHFLGFFNADDMPNEISIEEAKSWRQRLKAAGYAEATLAFLIKRTRTVFNWAVEKGWVQENIFKKVEAGSQVNNNILTQKSPKLIKV